ncbi:MAG: hypothetical protein OEM49_13415 [Myxococcales bacterium]|nr:hypothetical protein [Myxococcales bacterium]MDH5566409.1 hypothetical protein [Myxococcales bacterium]
MPPLTALAALLAGLISVALLVAGVLALRRRHFVAGMTGALLGLLLLALAALCAALGVSAQGYRALTREEVAATLWMRPSGVQIFEVDVLFSDARSRRFVLAGDQFYVDARILKWHPWANLLGLHTAYELDRISGRYLRLEDERDKPRTLFSLASERPLDIFSLRQRFRWLEPLVDAEYGSATFAAADRPATFEVRVSTTGLLVREVEAPDPR